MKIVQFLATIRTRICSLLFCPTWYQYHLLPRVSVIIVYILTTQLLIYLQ